MGTGRKLRSILPRWPEECAALNFVEVHSQSMSMAPQQLRASESRMHENKRNFKRNCNRHKSHVRWRMRAGGSDWRQSLIAVR